MASSREFVVDKLLQHMTKHNVVYITGWTKKARDYRIFRMGVYNSIYHDVFSC